MSFNKFRVLLVEPEPGQVILAQRAFAAEQQRFELLVAPTLADARRLIRERSPTLVITDLLLPDGRGTELFSATDEGPPVVVMTSQGDERVAVEAIQGGAIDYVVKSESAYDEIVHIARRALRQWRLLLDRDRAQAALRESEERFRQMAENSQQVFGLISADLRHVLYASPAYEKITGRCFDSLYENPRTLLRAVYPDDRAQVVETLRRRVADCSSRPSELEFRIQQPDGSLRWTRAILFSVCDKSGTPFRVGGVLEDVTQRKEAVEQLRERELQLAHVSRLNTMEELLAGIAHEVNQPLYAIANYAWACSRALAAENQSIPVDKLKDWCEGIQSAASRASEIIKRLREFTRRVDDQRAAVDLNETIEQSIELLSYNAQQQQVVFERELCDASPKVLADPIQLQQVMVNLLRNACESFEQDDAQGELRVVRVATRIVDHYAEVLVMDRGVGIPEDSESLFNAFVTTKPTGMGMGLAVSRSIVDALGGTIKARNNADGGATFIFTLPLVREVRSNGSKRNGSRGR
ncbi:MAG: ATP-binding protein [Pirellulaceae bacterium]